MTKSDHLQLFAIKTDGGMPIFNRIIGTGPSIPYQTISTFNSVYTFSHSNSVELQSVAGENGTSITWKNYNHIITLIIISNEEDANDYVMLHILDLVYNCLILHLGSDLITSPDNYERLKRDAKLCFPLIDSILAFKKPEMLSVLTLCNDVIIGPEAVLIQTRLEAFSESNGCQMSALFIKGRMLASSKSWQGLTGVEAVLIQKLVSLRFHNHSEVLPMIGSLSREIVVFLPNLSPMMPLRLLVFTILSDIDICFVCGETPLTSVVEKKIDAFWQMAGDDLRMLNSMPLKSIPSSFLLDPNLLSFLIVNNETKMCLYCQDTNKFDENDRLSSQLLVDFYEQNMVTISPSRLGTYLKDSSLLCNFKHSMQDIYASTNTHKFYALKEGSRYAFCVFRAAIPMYSVKSAVIKLLHSFLANKWSHI